MLFNVSQIKPREYDVMAQHYRRALQDGLNISFILETKGGVSKTKNAFDDDIPVVESTVTRKCLVYKWHEYSKDPTVVGVMEKGDIILSADYQYIDEFRKCVRVIYSGFTYRVVQVYWNDAIENKEPYEVSMVCKLITGR